MKALNFVIHILMIAFFVAILNPLYSQSPSKSSTQNDAVVVLKVVGTGRTTGHIADLTLKNNSSKDATVQIGPCFIPSSGGYQPYIVPGIHKQTIEPNGTTIIRIDGYCTDIHLPPVPDGKNMPPYDSWIQFPPNSMGVPSNWQPKNENGWQPVPSNQYDTTKDNGMPQLLVPGTDKPLNHTIDQIKYPDEAAPILLSAITQISKAYDNMATKGSVKTPFGNNPEKERESVIQQTFWIYAAALTGTAYKISDFEKKTHEQFEKSTGNKVEDLKPEQKKELDKGITDFWKTFEAVGAEAKVLKEKPKPTPVSNPEKETAPPAEQLDLCGLSKKQRSIPEFDFDMAISENAVNKEKIAEAKKDFEKVIKEIGKGMEADEDKDKEYSNIEPLASVYTLWAINHIGGYGNAVSKALVSNKYGRWNGFINNTEKISAHSKGERIVTMSGTDDKKCETTIVGIGVVSLRAHTVAFDPTARSIEILRGINFVGKVAMEVVKAYATGGASLSKSQKAKKALKEALEGAKKEVVNEQIGKMLEDNGAMTEDQFKEMVEWAEAIKDNELSEKVAEKLAEALGVDTKWITFDLEPADFAPIASDTYCKVKGKVDLTVGSKKGTIEAASNVLYNRKSLDDDPKDVMKGGGTHCPKALILSDVQKGSLTINLNGDAKVEAQAQGNGTARGYLSNAVTLVQFGICKCPNSWTYDLLIESGFYNGKPSEGDINMMKIRQSILEENINEYIKTFDGAADSPDPKEVQKGLEKIAADWAKEYACKD